MPEHVDWFQWFLAFFEKVKDHFAVVLDAAGCWEGWLQGEMFLQGRHGRDMTLFTNHPGVLNEGFADLFAVAHPPMVGEIKIVSAEGTVMDSAIEKDVRRLRDRRVTATEAYMVLVIPKSEKQTKLGYRLEKLHYSDQHVERDYGAFKVRIWRIE
ncbi:MAG: hypothetical protein IIA64_06635 [Planctomycetes bacterium]|nr:hypothetical protein [Planctomycetota bacterium]